MSSVRIRLPPPIWTNKMHSKQKKYFKTAKGKKALKKARKRYDTKDPEKRRRQKRDYMRRKRAEKRAGP